ncbi:toll/interleukin-1 receptor domain-containing protein [Flagellimonas zhangzhouensis]|uniref:TIR domain-containing protein n=1 Tax=Flagellimonas zhangzhouensis TaxID=1073328 RepID=A0A1H2WQK0_9FLAO|nr:toll/interleukin-1 receptor domain-containing protein [Allomuricauda zhangzhouensis]SDQ23697.1 TIR domain-containing protein [Allomuricauda zhangzhouensis]SDW82871.1 TIR domain-containing protein [Allomuricauda zhangzhouensis]
MKYKYQLILLGTLSENSKDIESLFFDKVSELKLPADAFIIIDERNFSSDYKQNQPAFCMYFGDNKGDFNSLDELDILIKDATPILPIFNNSFSAEIPKKLENYNGQKYGASKDNKIVNLALESFGKLRHTRKVFISYKREDSTSVAIQLYEALERNSFDVFLDTHSIKQGELFQEELWHRMTDCDVIVMLNTPHFMTSRWCKDELAEASAKQIGILQLIWPKHKIESISHICEPLELKRGDFRRCNYSSKNTSKLKNKVVEQIVQSVESLRARNLAARQDNLITEFTNIATKYGKSINLQPERYLTENLNNTKRRVFIPAVGMPQSIDCNYWDEQKMKIKGFKVDSLHLIYDDIRIREKWLNHLAWLNKSLPVKTIKKQEFDRWLKSN